MVTGIVVGMIEGNPPILSFDLWRMQVAAGGFGLKNWDKEDSDLVRKDVP
jgi:hypothetical protein